MNRRIFAAACCLVPLLLSAGGPGAAGTRDLETGAFAVEYVLVLPGAPETIYDAITGDISGWWDHSYSDSPVKFYIEAKPGGGFWEIFDDTGDGVLHARVTFARRGKMLRFEGPLGLAGNAVHMVHTYEFAHAGTDSTRLQVTVHAAGEMIPGWPEAVDKVWFHFLVERFKPYVESGQHLRR